MSSPPTAEPAGQTNKAFEILSTNSLPQFKKELNTWNENAPACLLIGQELACWLKDNLWNTKYSKKYIQEFDSFSFDSFSFNLVFPQKWWSSGKSYWTQGRRRHNQTSSCEDPLWQLRFSNRTDSVYKCDSVPAKSVEMTGCAWTAINYSASLSPDLVTKNVVNRIITAEQCPYYISVCFQPARHLIELIIAALKSQIALWTRRLFRKIVRYILFGSMRSELRLDYDNNLNVMQIAKKSFVYLECWLETLNAITLVLKTAHVRDLERQQLCCNLSSPL